MNFLNRCCLGGFVASLVMCSNTSAGLIGHWQLNDGAGNTAADSSPSGTTGQITNDATGGLGVDGSVWVDDATRGTVAGFNGAADSAVVRVGNIPEMTLDNDFTWAFWANQDADQTTPNDIIVGNRRDENDADFVPRQFIKFTPTKFEWHMNGNGDDNLDYEDIPSGQWLHHAVVKDGDSLTYYMNGVESAAGTFTQPLTAPMPLYLGGSIGDRDGENWRGLLSDVRVYDNALSPAEVQALVPEPSSLMLLIVGLLSLMRPRRR